MRIIAGEFRGRKLAALGKGDVEAHLRPTPDRVRESLFNLLASRLDLHGLRVLDLFAGTGALGLEAVSRGAAEAVFVENGRTAQRLIRQNIDTLGVADRTRLIGQDATRLGPADGPFDLVFLDPPYGQGMGALALRAARDGRWLAPDAFIVWEEDAAQPAPAGFDLLEHRPYGDTHLTLLETSRVRS